jgi:hypothetical protein
MDSQDYFQKVLDVTSGKVMHGGEYSGQSTEARATTRLLLLLYLLPGDLSTVGASNGIVAVFGHEGLYRRYLYLLAPVATGRRSIGWEFHPTMFAHSGVVIYDLGGVEKGPSMSLGTLLLTRLSTCWGSRRISY